MRNIPDCIQYLTRAGIAYDDAIALRKISMTLHRWHELECGHGDDWSSWAIVRGKRISTREKTEQGLNVRRDTFEHDDNGKPYMEVHPHKGATVWNGIADREAGAKRRLAKILARYPGWQAYIQGDPRGCALYMLRPGDVREGQTIDSCYTNGIAVYK